MSRGLVLLRHGSTDYNASGRLQGQLDVAMSPAGEDEVRAIAPAVLALAPAAVVSSDLVRARRTADLIGLPYRVDGRLREIDVGGWQGLTLAEAREQFPDEFAAWRAGRDVRRGGGETYAELAARAVAAIGDALDGTDGPASEDHPLLVVAHGGTARAATASLLGLPPETWWRLAGLANGTWTRLEEGRAGWRLVQHGARPG